MDVIKQQKEEDIIKEIEGWTLLNYESLIYSIKNETTEIKEFKSFKIKNTYIKSIFIFIKENVKKFFNK